MKIKKILLPLFIILFLFFLKTDSVLEAGGCPPDPTLTLTGSQVLKPGESTSFYYSIPSGWNKGACSMDGGNVSGSGTRTEWPSEDTTYRIVCSQEVCTKQKCSNTPEGMECECVATDTCSASSASYNIKVLTVKLEGFDVIQYYEYPNSSSNLTTLKWQASSGFDSCTASSNPAGIWSGSKPLSGSQDVAINQNTTFTLTCTRNSNPSYAKSASVTVSYTLSRCTDRAGCISVTPTSRQGAGPVTVNWTLNQAPDTYRVFYIEEGSDIIHPIIGTQSSGVPYSGSSSGSQTVNISKTTYFFLEMDKGSEHSCEDTGGGGSDDCCIGWLVNRTAGYVQLTGNNGTVYGLQSYGVWAGYIHNSRLGIYSSSGSTYTGCAYGTGGYGGPGGTVTTKLYRSCQLGLDGRLVCTVNCIDIPGWHAVEWAKAEVTSAPTACSCTATATPNPIPPGQSTTTIDVTNLNHTSKDKCKVENYNLPYTFTQTDSSKTYTVNCTGDSGYTNCTCDVTVTKGTGRCDCSNFTCSPSGTGPVCATDDDCTCSACWGSSGYICTTNSNCQAGTDKGLDHCPSGQTCCKPTTSAKYACNTNTWQCYQSSTGPYSSLTECQTNCHPSPVRYACNTNTWQCYQSSTGPYSSLTECQTNCHPSPVRYACNTTTWRCYQSDSGPYDSLGACENECKPFYCDTTNWQCYQDRNRHSSLDAGPYGSSGECIDNCVPCVITSFNFKPTKIFLSQTTTASWSTNACTNCQASCGPAGCGDWSGDKLTSGSQYVTPTAVGTYNYTLSCWNNKNGTSDTKEVPVEVYKAPIWREVAPKLGGYLWGIVFGK